MQYTKLFFSSFQAVALFSTRKTLLSSLNDCEAIKQLSEDAGGLLKLIQKARNLARNSCIAVALNRPFPSWSKPLFQSDAKCKAVDMKRIIQYSHANKTNFHMKGFALSLVLKVRGFRTWSIWLDSRRSYLFSHPWKNVVRDSGWPQFFSWRVKTSFAPMIS